MISPPMCRCAECLKGGTEVVDWQFVYSIEGYTVWRCNVCGRQSPLQTYNIVYVVLSVFVSGYEELTMQSIHATEKAAEAAAAAHPDPCRVQEWTVTP